MLPLHTHPRPGEILSSWLVRLALENGLPVHTFYYSLLQYHGQIWTRDIDRHPPQGLLNTVAKATGQTLKRVTSLCLTSYEGRLYEHLPINGDAPWLMPAGIYHRTRKRPGMQFCPACLSCDDFPYYRKLWRTSLAAMCELHRCSLYEYCPNCQALIVFHQHGMGRFKNVKREAGRFCHHCHFDFSMITVPVVDASSSLVDGYADLLLTLSCDKKHYLDLAGGNEFLLFKGVRAIVGALGGRNGGRLRHELGILLHLPLSPDKGKDFEYQSAQFRLNLMLTVVWLLKKWPERFCEVCSEAGFTRSRFSETYSEVPFWVMSVIDEHLNTAAVSHSYEEVESAVKWLQANGELVCWKSLGNLLGLKRDSAKSALKMWMVQAGLPQGAKP